MSSKTSIIDFLYAPKGYYAFPFNRDETDTDCNACDADRTIDCSCNHDISCLAIERPDSTDVIFIKKEILC